MDRTYARLQARSSSKKRDVAFVAPAPELSGQPGIRVAECVDAQEQRRGNKCQVVLTFETEQGEQGRLWCDVPQPLTPGCRYMRLVRIAHGGDLRRGDNIHPRTIFLDRTFRVMVGYRRTQLPRGKGSASEGLAEKRKDDKDFLRVIDLIEVLA